MRMPRTFALTLAALGALTLPACTADVAAEQASRAWAESSAADAPTDVLAGVVALGVADGDSEASGILDFATAPFLFTEFAAGCVGDGPVRLQVGGMAGDAIAAAKGVDLVCDGELHEFTMPGGGGLDVDSVGVSATAEAPVSVVVRIPTPAYDAAAEDEWAGYFDERAAQLEQPVSASWGSFGGEDVAPSSLSDASITPGTHRVSVDCAGAPMITVTLTPGVDGQGAPEDVVTGEAPCPGGATFEMTTTVPGLTVGVDSHGERGAFLFAIDPVG